MRLMGNAYDYSLFLNEKLLDSRKMKKIYYEIMREWVRRIEKDVHRTTSNK